MPIAQEQSSIAEGQAKEAYIYLYIYAGVYSGGAWGKKRKSSDLVNLIDKADGA